LEAYLKWGDRSGAGNEFKALKELWEPAKKEFSGEQWESNWADWNRRWEKIRSKFAEPSRPRESSTGKK
jgi:hypothetical protein